MEKQKAVLRAEFQNIGWKCRELLAKMDVATDFYFDTVSQIKMNEWSKDRVTLVGDACDCPSLLSGQGSTLAMAGAYILAGELKVANGRYQKAFARYEQLFKPFITKKQSTAKTFARSFVPKSEIGIWMRNTFINLMFLPYFSRLFVRRFMYDSLKLKDY